MLTTPDPILGQKRPIRIAKSIAKKREAAEKRARLRQLREEAELEGWRDIDPKVECFEMKPIPNLTRFLTLRTRAGGYTKPINIFTQLIDDEVLNFLVDRFPQDKLIFSSRNWKTQSGQQTQALKCMQLSFRDVLQVMAYYIRIIGQQCHDPGQYVIIYPHVKEAITRCREHFQQLCPASNVPVNYEKARRILAHSTLDGNEAASLISKKFQAMVLTLGQNIAGDEKLFTFHGESGNVRLVPSKPGKVGLWEYELCGQFQSGLPYLFDTSMHDLRDGTIKVSAITRRWIRVLKSTGDYLGETEPEVISEQQLATAAASVGESDDERDNGSGEQEESSIAIDINGETLPEMVASVARSPVVLCGIAAQRAKEQAEMKELLALPNKNPLIISYYRI